MHKWSVKEERRDFRKIKVAKNLPRQKASRSEYLQSILSAKETQDNSK